MVEREEDVVEGDDTVVVAVVGIGEDVVDIDRIGSLVGTVENVLVVAEVGERGTSHDRVVV